MQVRVLSVAFYIALLIKTKRLGDSMKETLRGKLLKLRDFILARGKYVFPVLLIIAVAITVVIALRAGKKGDPDFVVEETGTEVSDGDAAITLAVAEEPLKLNEIPEVNMILNQYYTAKAEGDVASIESIQNYTDDMERIKIPEFAKYIVNYPLVDVYTKPGPEEGSYIAIAYTHVVISYYPDDFLPGYETFYICTDEDGKLYINKGIVDENVSDYIRQICLGDDVVELTNKITVEYNEVCLEKPEFLQYLSMIEQQVQEVAGVILAQEIAGNVSDGDAGGDENSVPTDVQPSGPVYATANTTVNVRSSDSETADKLGKVTGGTKVEVIEQRVNGWSKIDFNGKEGYIKSEFLDVAESATNAQTIGTVTAKANVNVRATASEQGTKLGIVTGGETLELIDKEGDWCKVVYNGQVGYVKAEFVQ